MIVPNVRYWRKADIGLTEDEWPLLTQSGHLHAGQNCNKCIGSLRLIGAGEALFPPNRYSSVRKLRKIKLPAGAECSKEESLH